MDPCPFVRLIIESMAVKLPSATKPAGPGVHPSTTPCYAKLKLKNFPTQTAILPLCPAAVKDTSPPDSCATAAAFHLDPPTLKRLAAGKPVVTLKVSVFAGRMGRTCGVTCGKLLGEVHVRVDLSGAESRPAVFQNCWAKLGGDWGAEKPVLHLVVRSEPDPRFVFQFEGEPECSPVVYQIQGNIRQPVFSCKFSAERNNRTRSLPSDFTLKNRGWMRTFSGEREKKPAGRDRKGWMIIIYDLSGSSVAAASMITPFVPSPGSDRVSRSNPGAWLILRPNGARSSSVSTWKPWGRLEAWRERGSVDGLGYKFELVSDTGGVPIAEGTMSVKKGGVFCIDNGSKSSAFANFSPIRGFVMSSSVEGEGKNGCPWVQVGVKHVTCMPDAALFVAVSAAIDLSMDACMLFSQKLRKELCYDHQHDYSFS